MTDEIGLSVLFLMDIFFLIFCHNEQEKGLDWFYS